MFDLIIVGAGPAGLTAGIYAKRAGLNALILDKSGAGGQVLSTYEVDNYPGLLHISGMELGERFGSHLEQLGISVTNEEVIEIEVDGDIKRVVTNKENYESKGIVLCLGASHLQLGIEGENELVGAGVSYCATCDGAFYKGANVAVVGGGDVALEDALYLARTSAKVYLIHRRNTFRGTKSLFEAVQKCSNIEIVYDSVVEKLKGVEEGELSGLVLRNVTNNKNTDIELEGMFVAIGTRPNTDWLPECIDRDEKGYVIAAEDCRTNIPNVYVCGDARRKPLRQIVSAVCDGAVAVNSFAEDMN